MNHTDIGRIQQVYGVDVSDIKDGSLLEIFRRIDERQPWLKTAAD